MNTYKIHQASLLIDSKNQLGEGVLWHPVEKALYWVDISLGILHCFNPKTEETESWQMGYMIGTVVPAASGGLVVALENGIFHFNSSKELIRLFDFPESPESGNRFNDGKCDPSGRLWVGTMNKWVRSHAGSLYCFDGNSIITKLSGLTISNGMAWSADQSIFYFIDTVDYAVVVFDFDNQLGSISNKRKVIEVPLEMGAPDGMTIDREGKLWIAHWGGSCVARWDPENGQLLEIVKVAAPHITSCTFGGENLQTLYISTAREGLTEKQLKKFPLSGGLFYYLPETGGTRAHFFK
ncbi:gluconolactonase [Aquipluma nitroreducens]|uniref:Gluconolactonase n=1 Tax=Aquipluma nitroreducens TaxID=2010828 RepID=A0A5K7S3D5_9BACT|nr:SMP-30/gluconolactonase/LRE family protein [Aquipluma nitroreducens]BBE16088.1 gluconolactonase [Aquipluma nitroreducens]